ncbi:hypothetical protein [Herbaspirillum sp. ST 5-3]|uniref:hypothetical protein n=1 Tax=Oxalobacteraceae TaxID=75682 RepID=UPI0010A51AA8|nr:hypothetical protein [Herbaspirillum sp. ST 5-3]
MNINVGEKALVTVDNWFYAPDGRQYRAVFGTVRAIRTSEESLGVKTNAKSTNWYLEIGNITIAGCQVHYALRTDECHTGYTKDWMASTEHGLKEYNRPSAIYDADTPTTSDAA